jgi:hypothetical protein
MAENIFKRAKEYRTKHPRTSFQDAIKKVSGVKKRTTVRATKTVKPGSTRRGNSTGPSTVHTGTLTISGRKPVVKHHKIKISGPAIGAVAKGKKIVHNIEKMERERKTLKSKEMKNLLALAINAEHDKLDNLKRAFKRA